MSLNLKVKCPTRSPVEGDGLKAWLTNLHRYVKALPGAINTALDGKLDNTAATLQPLSEDPDDPPDGRAVYWLSDGTDSGDAGDIMIKINAGGTVKTDTWIDYSAI